MHYYKQKSQKATQEAVIMISWCSHIVCFTNEGTN